MLLPANIYHCHVQISSYVAHTIEFCSAGGNRSEPPANIRRESGRLMPRFDSSLTFWQPQALGGFPIPAFRESAIDAGADAERAICIWRTRHLNRIENALQTPSRIVACQLRRRCAYMRERRSFSFTQISNKAREMTNMKFLFWYVKDIGYRQIFSIPLHIALLSAPARPTIARKSLKFHPARLYSILSR